MRVSWHDIAARVTASVPRDRLARAIERLSAAYREGRSVGVHRARDSRAAYLVHTLPAHVCDERALLLELPHLLEGEDVVVVALGAGPGTEVLALMEACVQLGLPLRKLEVVRVDRVREWDEEFPELLAAAKEALDPPFEVVARETIVADLTAPAPRVVEAIARARVVLAANLVSELEPRGTGVLPGGFSRFLKEAKARAFLIMDRANAPGVRARLEEAARVLDAPSEVREREVRCTCALTKATKALYSKVRLPTTKHEDRPIGSARTGWVLAESW